jgi:gamma-glutamyltranspeptidase/glutathione hydrolase
VIKRPLLSTLIGWFLPVVAVFAQADAPLPKGFQGSWRASGDRGAVAAGGQKSVEAGLQRLQAGGNAADAAAATILALTVTDSGSVCFGGEVPILYYDAKTKTIEVIAGQGVAPRLATRAHFAEKPGGIPGRGIEAATVPALLDAVLVLLERHGTISFAEAVEPTLRLLDEGKEAWHDDLSKTLHRLLQAEATAQGNRTLGLRRVADTFYRGPIAREIDAWARTNGALIRFSDLATHVSRIEDPVSVPYRHWTVVKCGAWTQGPMLLQSLQLLEKADLKSLGRHSPAAIHSTVEAIKLAMADRDTYYADPLFVDVPLNELLSPPYVEMRWKLIDPKRASLERRPGDPLSKRPLLPADKDPVRFQVKKGPVSDTTTCLTADAEGNVVAATPSGWSGVVAGSTGVWLGSRLQSFNLWEGHPDVLEPGKRPRITLTPTIVLNSDGVPVLAVSVAGGDNQAQMTLQLVTDALDFGIPPAESVRSPRFMSDHLVGSFGQTPPDLGKLRINPGVGELTLTELKAMGHRLDVRPGTIGAAPVLLSITQTGTANYPRYRVAGDPQAGRHVQAH